MSKRLAEQFDDLGRAIADLKRELHKEIVKILDAIERFVRKFWPGLSKEKDD